MWAPSCATPDPLQAGSRAARRRAAQPRRAGDLLQAQLLRRLNAPEARDMPALKQSRRHAPASASSSACSPPPRARAPRRRRRPRQAAGACSSTTTAAAACSRSGFNQLTWRTTGGAAIVHAEAHAVADAGIRTHGERARLGSAFPVPRPRGSSSCSGAVGHDEADLVPQVHRDAARAVGVRAARPTSAGRPDRAADHSGRRCRTCTAGEERRRAARRDAAPGDFGAT